MGEEFSCVHKEKIKKKQIQWKIAGKDFKWKSLLELFEKRVRRKEVGNFTKREKWKSEGDGYIEVG